MRVYAPREEPVSSLTVINYKGRSGPCRGCKLQPKCSMSNRKTGARDGRYLRHARLRGLAEWRANLGTAAPGNIVDRGRRFATRARTIPRPRNDGPGYLIIDRTALSSRMLTQGSSAAGMFPFHYDGPRAPGRRALLPPPAPRSQPRLPTQRVAAIDMDRNGRSGDQLAQIRRHAPPQEFRRTAPPAQEPPNFV